MVGELVRRVSCCSIFFLGNNLVFCARRRPTANEMNSNYCFQEREILRKGAEIILVM